MGSPANLGSIPVYLGDPFDMTLTFQGMDRRGFTHRAQIRVSATDQSPVGEFEISTSFSDGDTTFTFHLDGDSAAGADAPMRAWGRSVVFDFQEYNTDGSSGDTLAVGALTFTQDVTRG